MKTYFTTLLVSLVFLLSGCASAIPKPLPGKQPLTRITAIGDTGVFAADRSAKSVAVGKNGLALFDTESSSRLKLSSDDPVALAWNPEGTTLAAAFPVADYETRLSLYSQQGALVSEHLLPVALTQLNWSTRGDLLAVGYFLKVYSFGANLRQLLYRVNGEDVVEILLTDSTLRPSLATGLAPVARSLQPVSFSPAGDELVFVFLHDPPEFAPYLQLTYQNWQSDEGRSLERLPLQAMHFAWDSSGRTIDVILDKNIEIVDLWPSALDIPVPAPAQTYRFADGRLYHGRELLADWGEGARLQILDDGRFLLTAQRSLYIGDGLQPRPRQKYDEKAWNLRRWRYQGLITQDEYLNLLQENNE